MEMNSEEIREAILRHYPTLKEFAKKAGILDTQLSKWIKNPSTRFKAILQKEGIIFSENMITSEREIENYADIIKELKTIIYEKNSYIKDLDKLLEAKDKVIEQLNRAIEINERIKE
ncbi:MAG: hypothetical protein QY331_07495 [Melioribacteraceae bacterium]|nr:MAG: hypothetical protein QY331_07495 [Melioribacteraceae bacterium]